MYAGWHAALKWVDPPAGIPDLRHYGKEFMVGAAIFMSRKTFRTLVENIHLVEQHIIDDVSIGLAMNKLGIGATSLNYVLNIGGRDLKVINKYKIDHDRKQDVVNMTRDAAILLARQSV